jgi:hypothetical protein
VGERDFNNELSNLLAAEKVEEAMRLVDEVTEYLLPNNAFVGINAREAQVALRRIHWYIGERIKEE